MIGRDLQLNPPNGYNVDAVDADATESAKMIDVDDRREWGGDTKEPGL